MSKLNREVFNGEHFYRPEQRVPPTINNEHIVSPTWHSTMAMCLTNRAAKLITEQKQLMNKAESMIDKGKNNIHKNIFKRTYALIILTQSKRYINRASQLNKVAARMLEMAKDERFCQSVVNFKS